MTATKQRPSIKFSFKLYNFHNGSFIILNIQFTSNNKKDFLKMLMVEFIFSSVVVIMARSLRSEIFVRTFAMHEELVIRQLYFTASNCPKELTDHRKNVWKSLVAEMTRYNA